MAASAMSARAHVAPAASSLNAARRGRASSTAPARRARRVSTTPRASIADLPKDNASVKVLVVGGTGYIGKFVVRELCAQGYDVTAFVREKSGIGGKSGKEDARRTFPDATVKFGSVSDVASIRGDAFGDADGAFDVVVSCLASRTGGIKDSWDVDYQATKNVLDVAREKGAKHFVLLSAICVQKPLLTFQKARSYSHRSPYDRVGVVNAAKLKFEEELAAASSEISHSIVRPTAFFKSLAGQVESVQKGGPYVMFGDGQLASCKPISERDLAKYMAECIRDPKLENKILPIGGPGEAMSALQQGTMLFEILGMEPKFIKVPIEVMDGVIKVLDTFAGFFSNMRDAAEFGKIGRYYAAESMLVLDDEKSDAEKDEWVYDASKTPSYGTDTLGDFFKKVSVEGLAGQELGDQAVFK
ncbi:3,8-divinyl protochlorophyllide a 8-vinyl reductase [Micromonas pusilla CCMP1545]|uniref:Divinyl chlorophyllide a 8-vinyl-reductase, chloroplastic n=1 Tax=Micromonas pusilla (strain CCMP1545) TaxID=564608 RepID=C1MYE3_MICPC|nr:3,8-divinyl protochlorophyllide a 8-vinyl reductase [Micromonas pusilla CCMP1545]EEH55039.1 3,8-divinyl protochlorophyllide a 8-vinyl reductase [Micromonas pusilla CCMP1545]|eukprot:XP_003060270.1 3,8-divinyl protochlorophyllide a 8-vinyl reductase [Micromonas pusilla CCMP1545]